MIGTEGGNVAMIISFSMASFVRYIYFRARYRLFTRSFKPTCQWTVIIMKTKLESILFIPSSASLKFWRKNETSMYIGLSSPSPLDRAILKQTPPTSKQNVEKTRLILFRLAQNQHLLSRNNQTGKHLKNRPALRRKLALCVYLFCHLIAMIGLMVFASLSSHAKVTGM